MNREKLEAALAELPLYVYDFLPPEELEFTQRVRWVCQHDCAMYNTSWACPPAVGSVEECRARCMRYNQCLMISTITEVADISDIRQTLDTRAAHEEITNRVRDILRELGAEPYVLSTESCAICRRCAWLDGQPCRHPERMHPCVESHGIVISELAEAHGIPFQYGDNVVTWFSLLFYREEQ